MGGLGFKDFESFNIAFASQTVLAVDKRPECFMGKGSERAVFPQQGVHGGSQGVFPILDLV